MHSFAGKFLVRWFACSVGLWLAALLLSSHISFSGTLGAVVGAGFILAVINTLLRPILIFFSLPALLVTLGLFMLIINGFTVYLASKLYTPLHVTNFWAAVFAGIVIGLVNYMVTTIL